MKDIHPSYLCVKRNFHLVIVNHVALTCHGPDKGQGMQGKGTLLSSFENFTQGLIFEFVVMLAKERYGEHKKVDRISHIFK